MAKAILSKRNKVGGTILCDFKTLQTCTDQAAWYCHITDTQTNETE
jgi:hypothetical protein